MTTSGEDMWSKWEIDKLEATTTGRSYSDTSYSYTVDNSTHITDSELKFKFIQDPRLKTVSVQSLDFHDALDALKNIENEKSHICDICSVERKDHYIYKVNGVVTFLCEPVLTDIEEPVLADIERQTLIQENSLTRFSPSKKFNPNISFKRRKM
jgi:hypothetical protein